MDEQISYHVVSSDPERTERLASLLPAPPDAVHADLASFRQVIPDGPSVVVVDLPRTMGDGVGDGGLFSVLKDVADRDLECTVMVPDEDGEELALRSLSLGFPVRSEAVAVRIGDENGTGAPFDLHEALRFAARIRHDINNPLTAGMAETQLLLMDLGEEGEVGESLLTIQRQLQRIQGLVQDLGRLRRPRRG